MGRFFQEPYGQFLGTSSALSLAFELAYSCLVSVGISPGIYRVPEKAFLKTGYIFDVVERNLKYWLVAYFRP